MKKIKMIIPRKEKSFLSNKFMLFNMGTLIAFFLMAAILLYVYIIYGEPIVRGFAKQYFRAVGTTIMFVLGCASIFVIAVVSKFVFHLFEFRCPFCKGLNKGDTYFCKDCLRKIDVVGIYNYSKFIECSRCGEFQTVKENKCKKCGLNFAKFKKKWRR